MTRLTLIAATLLLTLPALPARADDSERWNLHAQFTAVAQRHDRFTSPYAGPNSLRADEGTKTTMDATAYLGLRLWPGAELYLNPELDRGFGLSNTQGAAGFPSGEAYIFRYIIQSNKGKQWSKLWSVQEKKMVLWDDHL